MKEFVHDLKIYYYALFMLFKVLLEQLFGMLIVFIITIPIFIYIILVTFSCNKFITINEIGNVLGVLIYVFSYIITLPIPLIYGKKLIEKLN